MAADDVLIPPISTTLADPQQVASGPNGTDKTAKEWYYYWGAQGRRINALNRMITHGPHANRPNPSTMPDGAIYIEDDRGATNGGGVIYEVQNNAWHYLAGAMYNTFSPDNMPTDLGVNDAGFTYHTTDADTNLAPRTFVWSQSAWIETTGILYGTHSARPAANALTPPRTLYIEIDRGGVIYQQQANAWQYLAGTMWGTMSPDQRPTDLGVNDAGFTYRSTDAPARSFVWSQTAWIETTPLLDPTTTSGDTIYRGATAVTRLPIGPAGDVLTVSGGLPVWAPPGTVSGGGGGTSGVASVFGRTGTVLAATGDYNAGMVTGAVSTFSTYADPGWLTSLSWSKITSPPATGVSSVFGRAGAVAAAAGDYTAAQVTNAADQTGSYANPAWITQLAWSKITGAPSVASYQTPWLNNINGGGFGLSNINSLSTANGAVNIYKDSTCSSATTISTAQLILFGNTNHNMQIVVGYDTTAALGVIQPMNAGVAYSPLQLCPFGGNVGIGMLVSPSTLLSLGTSTSPIKLAMYDGGASNCYGVGVQSGILTFGAGINPSSGTPQMVMSTGGNVGIGVTGPLYQLTLSLDSAAKPTTSTWTVASDIRTKRNVRPFEGDIDLIRKLDPIVAEYNGLGGTPEGARVVSFDAAKLREILPQAVSSVRGKLNSGDAAETDLLGVNIHEILFHMLRAIQQLDREVRELKAKKGLT